MGLHLASPSMARATTNLAPGITFAIAAVIGYSYSPLMSCVSSPPRSWAEHAGRPIPLLAFFYSLLYNQRHFPIEGTGPPRITNKPIRPAGLTQGLVNSWA
jgi:hypothetical protein